MPALLDPLRNTLDHLALDPKAREDRKYLVSMLRRLGYSEREIEQALGWEGDGPRVIEVEYVPPGQGPAPGSFTVVDDWAQPTPVRDANIGFSVARDAGDAARAHGWLDADDDAVAYGWLPDTVRFRERGASAQPEAWPEHDDWEPAQPVAGEQDWEPAETASGDIDWESAETASGDVEWEPAAAAPWPEETVDAAAGDWDPEATSEPAAWPEAQAGDDAIEQAPAEQGQWQVVEESDDSWTESETAWAEDWKATEPSTTLQSTQETVQPDDADAAWGREDASTWESEADEEPAATSSWDEPAAWDEPAIAEEPEAAWAGQASNEYAITDAPAGAWPAPFTFEDYTLYTRMVELSTGHEQRIFFFAKNEPKSGQPCPLPPGYVVETNERTGLPFLRRDPEAETVDVSDWGGAQDGAEPEDDVELACLAITKAGSQCRNGPRDGSKYCAVHKGWRGPRVE